jgi:hypothetical protein
MKGKGTILVVEDTHESREITRTWILMDRDDEFGLK